MDHLQSKQKIMNSKSEYDPSHEFAVVREELRKYAL